MTRLSLAIKNTLVEDQRFAALLPYSDILGRWIFEDRPLGARFENEGQCLIVVSEGDAWSGMNSYNRQYYPTVYVDIWADSTRNDDLSVWEYDAKDKIEVLARLVDEHLHLVDIDDGGWQIFGTPDQIADRTGVFVSSSIHIDGPDYSEIRDAPDAWMGRLEYHLITA